MVRSRQGRAARRGPRATVGRRTVPRQGRRASVARLARLPLGPGMARIMELVVVGAAAALLRLWSLATAPVNPFYDAAVRSMGRSWHNFFFGALEPGGRIAVDKPPVDLWLQVASTKVLGFNSTALLLPEALGGIVAAMLLCAAIRPLFGRRAGVLCGLALAVLPLSVLTSRSDTMDSVMMALLVAALWASANALRTAHIRWVVVAAVLVGLAFNVKLSEALIPLPALALMWCAAIRGRRRILAAAAAAVTVVAVGMLWIFVASLTPARDRPFPVGSRNGSIYSAVFVYNGIERLNGTSAQVAPVGSASKAGPGRLLESAHPFYGPRIGLEIVAALALGLGCVLSGLRGLRLPRVRRGRLGRPATLGRRHPRQRPHPEPSQRVRRSRRRRRLALPAFLRPPGGRRAPSGHRRRQRRLALPAFLRPPGGRPGPWWRRRRPPPPAAQPVLEGRLHQVRRARPTARRPASPLADASETAAAASPAPTESPRPHAPTAAGTPPSTRPERDRDAHARRWVSLGLLVWLVVAGALFSAVRDLQPRYLEAVTPAVAAALGIGCAALLRRAHRRSAALLLVLALAGSAAYTLTVGSVPDAALITGLAGAGVALALLIAGVVRPAGRLRRASSALLWLAATTSLLAGPVGVSIDLIASNATAAGVMGSGAEFRDYIHANRHGAYYEVASASVYAVTTLIVADAQPVLVLNDFHGPLVTLAKLMDLVRLRALRHVIITRACTGGPHCPVTTRWSLEHSREVVRGGLYQYILPLTAGPAACSAAAGTTVSRPSNACRRFLAQHPPAPVRPTPAAPPPATQPRAAQPRAAQPRAAQPRRPAPAPAPGRGR
ncbi:MAG: hypothetical protein QOF77_1206 [Solirubrobacteraceae bacterium]|nr:hypothetical protein [Solirubrobacteraceae bacterium]